MELVFKTEVYEGPLDLLLALIAKNKMNIADIKIAVIFDQYMEYVENMEITDMDTAGEFIRMASELMLIKSRMLLPKDDEDPREELVRTLMEYKAAKEAAARLSELEDEFYGRFFKDEDEIVIDKTKLDDTDISLLSAAMTHLLMMMRDKSELARTKPIESINPLIKKKVVPIPARVVHIIRYMYKKPDVDFRELFYDATSRSGIIATFYAILELLKAGRITVEKSPDDVTGENVRLHFVKDKPEESDNG